MEWYYALRKTSYQMRCFDRREIMQFMYSARNKTGERIEGTIKADSKAEAVFAVERLGHVPISIVQKVERIVNATTGTNSRKRVRMAFLYVVLSFSSLFLILFLLFSPPAYLTICACSTTALSRWIHAVFVIVWISVFLLNWLTKRKVNRIQEQHFKTLTLRLRNVYGSIIASIGCAIVAGVLYDKCDHQYIGPGLDPRVIFLLGAILSAIASICLLVFAPFAIFVTKDLFNHEQDNK